MKRERVSDLASKLQAYRKQSGSQTTIVNGGGAGVHAHTLADLSGELSRTQAPWVATDITTAVNNYSIVADSRFLRIDGSVAGATVQAQEFQRGVVAVAPDTITSQLNLRSARAAIVTGNMIGGIDFQSNDTSLVAPGSVVASIKAVANAGHTTAQLGTDIVMSATTGTTTSEVMRVGGAGVVTIPKTLTAGWIRDSIIGIGGQGANDLGMLGLYDRNELTNADQRGTVTVGITGAGTVTANTINSAFNGRGGYLSITGTNSTTTQIIVHIDLGANQPNYSSANWQPLLQYRLSMNGAPTHYRTIVCEVSADNTNWYKPTAGQWETTTANAGEIVPGLWMGKNGNPSLPGGVWRYCRFTLSNRFEDAAYVSKSSVWISQIGLRHYAAPFSRAYMHTSGDTMFGNMGVRADSATAFDVSTRAGTQVFRVNTTTGSASISQSLTAGTSLNAPLLTHSADLTIGGVNTSLLPSGNLTLNPGGAVLFPVSQIVKTENFNSTFPIAGFQFNENPLAAGGSVLSIGKLVANELTVDIFVANETRVDRGNQYWTKSFGILAAGFTTPSAVGLGVLVAFENSPAMPGALFTSGDWLMFQYVDIDTGLVIETIWGQVYPYLFPSVDPNAQLWTFVLRAGSTNRLVKKGKIAVDWGQPGQAIIHLSTVDAAGSPYIKMYRWIEDGAAVAPYEPATRKVVVAIGDLDSGVGNSFYSPSGDGVWIQPGLSPSRFFVADDSEFRLQGINLRMYSAGGSQTVDLSPTDGSLKLGTNVGVAATTSLDFNGTTGNLLIGKTGGNNPNLLYDGLSIHLRQGTTTNIRLDSNGSSYFAGIMQIDTAGEIRQGSGSFGVDYTGLRVWNDGGIGRIGGYNSNLLQWYADTNGRLVAGGGNIWLDSAGTNYRVELAGANPSLLRFMAVSGSMIGSIGYYHAATPIPASTDGMIFYADSGHKFRFLSAHTTEFQNAVTVGTSLRVTGSLTAGSLTAGVSVGDVGADYTPTSGNWGSTGSTILLNALNHSTIGFHDSGNRVDFIRAGAGVITLGYDGGFGAARVDFGGAIGTQWNGVVFGSGWDNYGSGWTQMQYKRIGDVVVLNGLAKRASGTGTLIFTLPTGFRPIANVMVSATSFGGSYVLGRADIYPDGTCVLITGGTEFFPFFNVAFRIA